MTKTVSNIMSLTKTTYLHVFILRSPKSNIFII